MRKQKTSRSLRERSEEQRLLESTSWPDGVKLKSHIRPDISRIGHNQAMFDEICREQRNIKGLDQ